MGVIIRFMSATSEFSKGAVVPAPALFTSRVTLESSRRIRSSPVKSLEFARSAARISTLRGVSAASFFAFPVACNQEQVVAAAHSRVEF
jgi:hypothetical protein